MFPVDVGKHFPDLLLRQALGVECARKALALIFLVAQYGQYPGMEVAVPVTRYTECQCPTMTVATTGAVPVAPFLVFVSFCFYKSKKSVDFFLSLYLRHTFWNSITKASKTALFT